jgi:Fe-S cluster assembly ATPase SufC
LSAAGHELLHGIDLKVNAGESHAMMGPTGSGKSKLAQMLAGREDYHMTSGLDIDTLRIVASGINGLRGPERTLIVSTHYQW